MAGGAHRDVLQLGLEVEHLGQRHALGTAALLDQQHLFGHFGGSLRAAAAARALLSAGPPAGAPAAPAWSGSPPLPAQRPARRVRRGRSRRPPPAGGAVAQGLRQRQTVGAGHVDVQPAPGHHGWRCSSSMAWMALAASPTHLRRGLACSRPAGCAARLRARLSSSTIRTRQHVRDRHAGTSMRTWYTPSFSALWKLPCTSCSRRRRSRTLSSARPWPCGPGPPPARCW